MSTTATTIASNRPVKAAILDWLFSAVVNKRLVMLYSDYCVSLCALICAGMNSLTPQPSSRMEGTAVEGWI
jgi:hypothetical protein